MVKLNFDPQAYEVLSLAESDPDKAAEALGIAAKYLREDQPLPENLKDWLVVAFEAASIKPRKHRAKTLTDMLYLTSKNRRPAGNFVHIGYEFDLLINEEGSATKAADEIAAKYDIDQRTAKRYWKKYLELKEEYDKDLREFD